MLALPMGQISKSQLGQKSMRVEFFQFRETVILSFPEKNAFLKKEKEWDTRKRREGLQRVGSGDWRRLSGCGGGGHFLRAIVSFALSLQVPTLAIAHTFVAWIGRLTFVCIEGIQFLIHWTAHPERLAIVSGQFGVLVTGLREISTSRVVRRVCQAIAEE